MDYKIISTGSKGNAVIVGGDILIDCGVPFRAIREHYKKFKLVLLTHIHTDHFKPATVRKLARERPSLRFGCCEWMAKPLVDCGVDMTKIDVYNCDSAYRYGGNVIEEVKPFHLTHDVSNCGYKIVDGYGKKIFYATDTSNLDGIEAEGFDLYLIEANHGQAEISERIRNKEKAGEYAYERRAAHNHLSREAADEFIYSNIGTNGRYVYLHCHEEELTDLDNNGENSGVQQRRVGSDTGYVHQAGTLAKAGQIR